MLSHAASVLEAACGRSLHWPVQMKEDEIRDQTYSFLGLVLTKDRTDIGHIVWWLEQNNTKANI